MDAKDRAAITLVLTIASLTILILLGGAVALGASIRAVRFLGGI